jgi:uncharacterized protein (TIGR02246 family)
VSQIETNAAIEAVMADYAAAVLAKEPARLASLYAPDVRVFDAFGVWSFESREAWTRNLEDWLGSIGDEGVQVEFHDVCVVPNAGTGWLSAIVTYSALNPAGHVLRSMQNRLSWLLLKNAERWVIAHEHTSVPVDFESKKAILRRE